jgi:hypothetical protein
LLEVYVHDVFCSEGEPLLIPDHRVSSLYIIFHGVVEYCSAPDTSGM